MTRSLILSAMLMWPQAAVAQRVALIDGDDPASPLVRASLIECYDGELLDSSLVSNAVNGAGYDGSINLSLEEARRLGLVTGADVLVLIRSYYAASGNSEAPIESVVAGLVVNGRSGSLIHFELGRAAGVDRVAIRHVAARELTAKLEKLLTVRPLEVSTKREPVQLDLVSGSLPDGARPPRFFAKPAPGLTPEAERASIEATLDVIVTFEADGNYGPIWVVRWAGFGLEEEAIRAIRASKFLPAQIAGKAVSSRALLRYNFRVID